MREFHFCVAVLATGRSNVMYRMTSNGTLRRLHSPSNPSSCNAVRQWDTARLTQSDIVRPIHCWDCRTAWCDEPLKGRHILVLSGDRPIMMCLTWRISYDSSGMICLTWCVSYDSSDMICLTWFVSQVPVGLLKAFIRCSSISCTLYFPRSPSWMISFEMNTDGMLQIRQWGKLE